MAAPHGIAGGLSWLTGGGGNSFLAKAVSTFIEGGDYVERLDQQVRDRQSSILPVLRGAAGVTGDVLKDCRLASKRSFDVLKYDIYNRGVPKTPENVKQVANRMVSAAAETRHRFSHFIIGMATSITKDVDSKKVSASATVALSELSMLPLPSESASQSAPSLAAETQGSVAKPETLQPKDVDAGFSFLGL